MQVKVLERLEFRVIPDDGVEEDWVVGVLMFDDVGEGFEEDVQQRGIGFFGEEKGGGGH